MDTRQLDALTRALATGATRRTLLGALAAFGGGLAFGDEGQAGKRSRRGHRIHRRSDAGANAEKRKRKRRKKQPACQPESAAQTCAGRCGLAANNCGQSVDCGSCACGAACPVCQTCDASTGRCVTNTPYAGLACGLPGQVCLGSGECGCDGVSCPSGQRCNGIVCVCDVASCPDGCCDANRGCRVNEPGACGTGGEICAPCPACQTCANGACTADARQNRDTCHLAGGGAGVCCDGSCCSGCCDARVEQGACGSCLAFVTSTVSNGILGGLVGADRICQTRAEAGGFWGSYKAWLSNTVDSPSSRFRCTAASCSAQGYTRVDGVTLASDWADLITCDAGSGDCLQATLTLTEFNQPMISNPVWSNTRTNGQPEITTNGNCQNWTMGTNSFIGNVGFSELKDKDWSDATADPCNRGNSLYCFQQS